jgi:hypothetical protein
MAMVIVTFWQARGRSHVGCEAGGWHSLSDDVEINPTSSGLPAFVVHYSHILQTAFLAIRKKDDYGKF